MLLPRLALAALAGLLAVSGCTCAPRGGRTLSRWHLATLPDTYRDRSIFIADSGADAAYIETVASGDRVLTSDGGVGPVFPELDPPRMAPKSARVFYWALELVDGAPRILLQADGTRVDTPIARPGKLVFSPDGKRWAAVGGTEEPTALIPGPNDYRPGPVLLWLDGQPAGRFPDMALPAFSPDGAHLAVLVEAGEGRMALRVDGVEQRVFDAPAVPVSPMARNEPVGPNLLHHYAVRYLTDGSLLLLTTDRDGWSVWHGDRRLASYGANTGNPAVSGVTMQASGPLAAAAAIQAGSLTTASAAPVAAWWARDAGADGQWRVLRNAAPEPVACLRPFDEEPPALSADGRQVAYACHTAPPDMPGKVYVQHGGHRYGPYAGVWGVTLSADGAHVAFAADTGAADLPWVYVRDGRQFGLGVERAFPPRFSPDGRHLAWVGERNGRLILFLDGDGVASSDNLLWAPTFALKPDTLSWAVLRGRRVSRVDVGF